MRSNHHAPTCACEKNLEVLATTSPAASSPKRYRRKRQLKQDDRSRQDSFGQGRAAE